MGGWAPVGGDETPAPRYSREENMRAHPAVVSRGNSGSADKESTHHAGDLGSIPGLGRSPGEGNGYPPTKTSRVLLQRVSRP